MSKSFLSSLSVAALAGGAMLVLELSPVSAFNGSMGRLRIALDGRRTLALPKSLDRLRHLAQPHTVSAASAILPAVYSTPGIRWILSFSSIFFLSFTMSMIVCKDWRVMEASG